MKKLLAIVISAMVAGGAAAETRPFNLSLVPDTAVYNRTERIEGLTLSIWGENPQTALAVGIVNGSTGASAGLSLGVLNYAGSYRGVQWGLVNYTEQNLSGWQGGFGFGIAVSALNYTGGDLLGLQTGVVNYAGRLSGLQIGLVNYAATVDDGVQIGLVNIMPQNEWFTGLPDALAPGMILVNWRF
ncbi:MAG: hypothetical protein WC334_00320 [Kiritimatiellales bacterium]